MLLNVSRVSLGLIQDGYPMPERFKRERERNLHTYACLRECLHYLQHYAAYRKMYPQYGEVEELINNAKNHHSF